MRLVARYRKIVLWCFLGLVGTIFIFKYIYRDEEQSPIMMRDEKYIEGTDQRNYPYHRNMPLIFIGGVPRSGTTLMRAMLDAHPDVRCGQETRVIPRILQLRSHWLKSEKESVRLKEAGITKDVLNSAIAQFCLEIIAKHGDPAPRLCNKDPLTLKMGSYIIELFPQAKFLFMVRDGRATVHSIISRKVTITGFDLTNYRQCLTKWNHAIETMYEQCKEIGSDKCMMVYYEQLVLHPEEWMRKILKFLDVPWNGSVLHHEEFINKPNGVSLSKVERSSDQVIKPVNLEALTKWVDNIPKDVVSDMADIAPMLSVLGYDPYANPPDYGKPDSWVKDNTFKVKANQKLWQNKAKQLLRLDMPEHEQYYFNENIENTVNNNNNNLKNLIHKNINKEIIINNNNSNNNNKNIGNLADENDEMEQIVQTHDTIINMEEDDQQQHQQQQHGSNNNNDDNNNKNKKADLISQFDGVNDNSVDILNSATERGG